MADLKAALSHILWLGGAPDAGKSTIATILTEQYHLRPYHLDWFERAHAFRMSPEQQPHFYRFMTMSLEERWLLRSPETMAEDTIKNGAERVAMAVEDMLAVPRAPVILAEGPWLFPEYVAPLISSPRQAIWLVPTEAFKRASTTRRNKPAPLFEADADHQRHTHNLFRRDALLTEHIRREAEQRGLRVVEVDGTKSIAEMTALVEDHYGPLLVRSDDFGYVDLR